MSADPGREYVLTLSCPDKPGIVYAELAASYRIPFHHIPVTKARSSSRT